MIQTAEMEDLPKGGQVCLEIFTFEELSNNKTKLIIQDVFRSIENRDEMVESGFESGVVAIFEQLDNLIKVNFLVKAMPWIKILLLVIVTLGLFNFHRIF